MGRPGVLSPSGVQSQLCGRAPGSDPPVGMHRLFWEPTNAPAAYEGLYARLPARLLRGNTRAEHTPGSRPLTGHLTFASPCLHNHPRRKGRASPPRPT